jgi:hypothetical protein
MKLSKNQLYKVIANCNAQLQNSNVSDLNTRQRLVFVRESAYTAAKLVQTGNMQDALSVCQTAGIQWAKTSGHNASTWDQREIDAMVKQYGAPRLRRGIMQNQKRILDTQGSKRKKASAPRPKRDAYEMHVKGKRTNEHLEQEITSDKVLSVGQQYAQDARELIARGEHLLDAGKHLIEHPIAENDVRKGKSAVTRGKRLVKLAERKLRDQGVAQLVAAQNARIRALNDAASISAGYVKPKL